MKTEYQVVWADKAGDWEDCNGDFKSEATATKFAKTVMADWGTNDLGRSMIINQISTLATLTFAVANKITVKKHG